MKQKTFKITISFLSLFSLLFTFIPVRITNLISQPNTPLNMSRTKLVRFPTSHLWRSNTLNIWSSVRPEISDDLFGKWKWTFKLYKSKFNFCYDVSMFVIKIKQNILSYVVLLIVRFLLAIHGLYVYTYMY